MKGTEMRAFAGGRKAAEGRRIFFVDAENYVGRSILDEQSAEEVRRSIERQFAPGEQDLVVVGTSHSRNLLATGLAWQGARHVYLPGRNGADRALLEAIGQYRLSSFSEVFIVSGDGFFYDKACELAAMGVDVRIVSRPLSLNRRFIGAVPCLVAA